jgi:predicted Zn-dependent protease with MMP-like domain
MSNRKTNRLGAMVLAATLPFMLGACKTSGVAVTDNAQVMKINITAPEMLAERGEGDIIVEVANRGVNNLSDVEFEVEIPAELVVLDEDHGQGMRMWETRGSNGNRVFHYTAGDIGATEESEVKFRVRTAFGARDRSDDVKVTAWQKDLPGERLVETRYVRMSR